VETVDFIPQALKVRV